LKISSTISLLDFENQYWSQYHYIAGFDEAGRGAWAGPVAAAAVIFDQGVVIEGIDDSKKLAPKKREQLFDKIKKNCVSYGIALVDAEVIDEINILEATKKAMLMALSQLSPQPDLLFIDGQMTLKSDIPQKAIIDGDALSHSIAAASILAKVARDRLMVDFAKTFPDYGFEQHKGYGTKKHQQALVQNGCLSIHRKSYGPIAKLLR